MLSSRRYIVLTFTLKTMHPLTSISVCEVRQGLRFFCPRKPKHSFDSLSCDIHFIALVWNQPTISKVYLWFRIDWVFYFYYLGLEKSFYLIFSCTPMPDFLKSHIPKKFLKRRVFKTLHPLLILQRKKTETSKINDYFWISRNYTHYHCLYNHFSHYHYNGS